MGTNRLSGLISGMDTESLISQLMEARKTQVTKVKKTQMKQSVKQDAWKELNSKLKNLQSKYLSNMRFSSSYAKKVTKVSDSSVASVITGDKAVIGVQDLEVKELAKTAYLTGSELKNADGTKGDFTALSSLKDLGIEGSGSFKITVGDQEHTVDITEDTTISDVLNSLKSAGLNASFDEKNQRLFISAKSSGEANDFTISAVDGSGTNALSKLGISTGNKIDGQDSEILLNGASFKSSTNTFEINGLTITANAKTESGKSITLSTQSDTDGIYDMIKNFIKEYNAVINEMDKLYNAEAATGYEPLTSEEKDAMSDSEVEEWEKKVKDSVLRNDDNISTISSALKTAMAGGFAINGKKMYLSDFGIGTLNYFNSADNEKNAYHIDGDSDDADTSGNADKLKGMIASDPETVISFFTQLSQSLYKEMSDQSKSVDGYRSFGNFYDDKKMKTDYDSYTTKISEMEEKLNDYEDRMYKKFSQMESAMAKMQSKVNALSGLFGGN